MRLSEFIVQHREQLLTEWESFARTLLPASQAMGIEELRDHAEGILVAIAADLERPQSREQQAEKARGKSDPTEHTEARAHGALRAGKGFTLAQMISEFRALRASVLRLWADAVGEVGTNIEEVTRFNEAIDQALAQSATRFIEDLEHSKDMFLGILGHDLRNPLGAILMSTTQLLRQVNPNGVEGKSASRIMRSSIRMREIISDLLDFTRGRLGAGMPISRARVDLGEICQDTVDEVRAIHPDADVQLKTSGDLQGDWDGPRISQALSNLLGNALQHGAPDAGVTLTVKGEPGQVELSVHNRGPPIPRAQLTAIFLPLKRPEAAARTSGLGLGLFIAKEIVVAHGGVIEVSSTREEGTTFTIHLPRQAAREAWEAAEPAGLSGDYPAGDRG